MSELSNIRRRAKELSVDPGFKAIVKMLKERAIAEWANTPSDKQDRREELYRDIQAVGRLENLLVDVINSEALEVRKGERAKPKA